MGLDIRIPIGSLFAILGVLLAGYGLLANPMIYQRSLGIDINFWWGAALLAFGLAMLALAWRAAARRSPRDWRRRPQDTRCAAATPPFQER
jgi:protein-S-isoprenylcysteine O-methyltransferase Ste14